MIGNDLEIEIIELFRKDITRFLSINQIAKELGKSYPYIYKKVNYLISEKILNKADIGNATLCSINLKSEEAVILLSINEVVAKKKLLSRKPEVLNIIEEIKQANKEVPVHTAIYVKNKVLVVTESPFYKKTLEKEFSNAKVWTKSEFLKEIISKPDIIHTHTLLYHNEKYYELVGEIEQQLKIRNSPMYN